MFQRILIVERSRVYRECLVIALNQHAWVTDVITTGPSRAVKVARERAPDLVLFDNSESASTAEMEQLCVSVPETKVIALNVQNSEDEILAHMSSGIAGYLLESDSLEELGKVIAAAARGEMICSPRIAAALCKRVAALTAEHPREDRPSVPLTRRELEILELIEQGLSNKEIARRLSITLLTTKNHVHNILRKLKVRRRGEAASLYRRLNGDNRG